MTKQLKEIVTSHCAQLESSSRDFETIYRITFSREDLVMAEESDGFRIRRHTYGDVCRLTERVAAGLYARIGETHGFVGLQMDNSVNWIAAFWGILKSGNKPYLINTRHPKTLSDSILKTLGITTVVADGAGELSAEYLSFGDLPCDGDCPAKFENEIAIATSATSLQESICVYNGAAVAAQILNVKGILKDSKRMAAHYKGALKNLVFLPFYHIFGLFAVYFWFTFFGRTLVFLKDLSPDTILSTCRRHEVTHIFAVPLLWHTVEKQVLRRAQEQGELEKLERGLRFCTALQNVFPYIGSLWSRKVMHSVTDQLFGKSVKFCISGGSYLRESAMRLFNGIGYPLHNGYGMSEIGIASVELGSRPCDRNKNSIGKPFASVEYRLSESGTLLVRGDSVAVRRIVGGREVPNGEFLDTADVMDVDASGRYYIRGRRGDIVIGESGENINPDRLEQLFNPKDATALSVLGLPEERGEVLSMVVQVNEYLSAARIAALREELVQINETLPTAQQIRRFHMTHDPIAPATAIKVGRQYLRRAIENGDVRLLPFVKQGDAQAEASPLLKKVTEIVARVIGTDAETLDPDAHLLLDLGVTSLQYFAVLSALAEEFHVSADGNTEYAYTVRSMCDYIERRL